MSFNLRDIFYLCPEIVLTVWGLVVLVVDVGFTRRLNPEIRRWRIGWLSLAGVGIALVAATVVCLVPLYVRSDPSAERAWLSADAAKYFIENDPVIFSGTLAGDAQSGVFNIIYTVLLGLVIGLSMSSSFTEDWGEYFALLFWATVGMMLLTAAEELITLFLTLETMTICLYLSTALERAKRRSAEGGLKYFVYGSVSSALFLFGLSLLYGIAGTTQIDRIYSVLDASRPSGLSGNVAGATAILLMLVGFGFKVAAVPFHQWAPDAYEGAPAPVTAWIATGSKLASFVALMKVFLHAVLPWSNPTASVLGPGWVGIVAIISAVTMTYGNFAALAQRNFKRMLAYSSIAHSGYILVGVAAVSVSLSGRGAAGAVLYYLVVYAFANVGAFAVAAWLVRDKDSDDIDDLNGLGFQEPLLAVCILVLMLSLIGIPPLAGFFGKLYVFMEALNQGREFEHVTLIWLVALGLFNSVVSAFYYVRVLKAMFLRDPGTKRLAPPGRPIALPIVLGTIVVVLFGVLPGSLVNVMQAASSTMLTDPPKPPNWGMLSEYANPRPGAQSSPAASMKARFRGYTPEQLERMKAQSKGMFAPGKTAGGFANGAGAKGKMSGGSGKGAGAKGKMGGGFGKGAGAKGKMDGGSGKGAAAKGKTGGGPGTGAPEKSKGAGGPPQATPGQTGARPSAKKN
jgi:NADH-quinone oxidoreductase subunit N